MCVCSRTLYPRTCIGRSCGLAWRVTRAFWAYIYIRSCFSDAALVQYTLYSNCVDRAGRSSSMPPTNQRRYVGHHARSYRYILSSRESAYQDADYTLTFFVRKWSIVVVFIAWPATNAPSSSPSLAMSQMSIITRTFYSVFALKKGTERLQLPKILIMR